MLRGMLKRQHIKFLVVALVCISLGYGIAVLNIKRLSTNERTADAVARLWSFHQVLLSMESGEPKFARLAIAMEADSALATIAETEHQLNDPELRKFQSKVLKAYRAFRETHPDLYKAPPDVAAGKRDEWIQRDRTLSDFLTKSVN